MSYPRNLDDYSDAELRDELLRRDRDRLEKRCDYCRRPLHSYPPCAQRERHNGEGFSNLVTRCAEPGCENLVRPVQPLYCHSHGDRRYGPRQLTSH